MPSIVEQISVLSFEGYCTGCACTLGNSAGGTRGKYGIRSASD
jgi:hypothetical protein